jgi:hypothetical protein
MKSMMSQYVCINITILSSEMTPEVVQEKADTIKKHLKVNRKETKKYIRTLVSVPDERRSAKNIGIVGATVICMVVGFIISIDCSNFINVIQLKYRAMRQK